MTIAIAGASIDARTAGRDVADTAWFSARQQPITANYHERRA